MFLTSFRYYLPNLMLVLQCGTASTLEHFLPNYPSLELVIATGSHPADFWVVAQLGSTMPHRGRHPESPRSSAG